MILEVIPVGPFQANCYILADNSDSQAIIIDPGNEEHKIKQTLNKFRLKPAFIINTHGHIDHISCDDSFDVPIYIHRDDASLLKDSHLNLSDLFGSGYKVKSKIDIVEDKQLLKLGQIQLEVIHTPGHTPGGICLWLKRPMDKVLFTGDTLFCGSIGRTDFFGADERTLIESIKNKLFNLADDTIIYPGHGPISSIGKEKRNNPFLI